MPVSRALSLELPALPGTAHGPSSTCVPFSMAGQRPYPIIPASQAKPSDSASASTSRMAGSNPSFHPWGPSHSQTPGEEHPYPTGCPPLAPHPGRQEPQGRAREPHIPAKWQQGLVIMGSQGRPHSGLQLAPRPNRRRLGGDAPPLSELLLLRINHQVGRRGFLLDADHPTANASTASSLAPGTSLTPSTPPPAKPLSAGG